MNVTDDVLNDLLTLYLSGEASADTRALIEERARREPAFAAKMTAARDADQAAARAIDLPAGSGAPPSDVELRALTQTRHAIFLRTLFFATGLFCTLLPLAIYGDGDGVRFLILGRHPGIMWAFWSVAAASWTAWYVMNREVRKAGL
jgi:anti-sigma factor RsiW